MVHVIFTPTLKRHLETPETDVRGATVREALEGVFTRNERMRSYVLDDQGALRKHVLVFVNGQQVRDRAGLSDVLAADAELYVMQALSGG